MTHAVAAVIEQAGAPFVRVDIDLDEPRANEILVRVEAVGMCHTDLSVRAAQAMLGSEVIKPVLRLS